MAKLKTLYGKFALRTLPIEESFFYSTTGKNFPIYVSNSNSNSLTFLELRKKAISNDLYIGSSTIDIKNPNDASEEKMLDGHWMPLGNFIKHSRFVGKEVYDFRTHLYTKKTISLFERGRVALCVSLDLKNVNNYKLLFINKDDLEDKNFEYGRNIKDILKIGSELTNNEKNMKVYDKLSSKEGVVSILRVLFKDIFKDLTQKQIKEGFDVYPPQPEGLKENNSALLEE